MHHLTGKEEVCAKGVLRKTSSKKPTKILAEYNNDFQRAYSIPMYKRRRNIDIVVMFHNIEILIVMETTCVQDSPSLFIALVLEFNGCSSIFKIYLFMIWVLMRPHSRLQNISSLH